MLWTEMPKKINKILQKNLDLLRMVYFQKLYTVYSTMRNNAKCDVDLGNSNVHPVRCDPRDRKCRCFQSNKLPMHLQAQTESQLYLIIACVGLMIALITKGI